jgi:hypothetical protein
MSEQSAQQKQRLDSQSVKTAAMVTQQVGYDAGKKIKGRKRL